MKRIHAKLSRRICQNGLAREPFVLNPDHICRIYTVSGAIFRNPWKTYLPGDNNTVWLSLLSEVKDVYMARVGCLSQPFMWLKTVDWVRLELTYASEEGCHNELAKYRSDDAEYDNAAGLTWMISLSEQPSSISTCIASLSRRPVDLLSSRMFLKVR